MRNQRHKKTNYLIDITRHEATLNQTDVLKSTINLKTSVLRINNQPMSDILYILI